MKNLENTIIAQKNKFYNLYFLEGKEIDSIKFYDENGVITSVNWFGSNNMYPELHLPFSIRRAIKVNFTKKDAFFVKSDYEYSSRIDVYIYYELVNLKNLGEKRTDCKTSVQYCTEFSVKIDSSKKSYTKDETGQIAHIVLPVESREIIFQSNYRTEKNDEGKRLAKIMQAGKAAGFNWSEYDIQNIEKVFDLRIK